jgi:enoyl-CoA hydratase/carnithine racemase
MMAMSAAFASLPLCVNIGAMTDVTLTVSNHVATVTLDRASHRNRLSLALMESLIATCTALGERDDVRVVVLRGAGRDFSTGADLTDPGMRAIAAAPLGDL